MVLAIPAGLEHGKEAPNSAHSQTQLRIAKKMLEAYAQANGGPVFFIAQSLGCQVLSCYLYDAQQAHGAGKIKVGLFRKMTKRAAQGGDGISDQRGLQCLQRVNQVWVGRRCRQLAGVDTEPGDQRQHQ